MNNEFPTKPVKETKHKRTLFEVIKNRIIEKPATLEEIEQLKLNAVRARLKADIAKSKAVAKQSKPNPLSLFIAPASKEPQHKKRHTKRETDQAEDLDLRKAVGTNDKSKYKDLTG